MSNDTGKTEVMVLCMGEQDYFPISEFDLDEDGHPIIHHPPNEYKHYAADGLIVDPVGEKSPARPTTPGTGDQPPPTEHPIGYGFTGSGKRSRQVILNDPSEHFAGVAVLPSRYNWDKLFDTTVKDKTQEPQTPPTQTQQNGQDSLSNDLLQAYYQAILDEAKAERDALRQMISDAQANDYTRAQSLFTAHLNVAAGQIDRAQSRAGTLIQAAGAIGTLYAAILGLAFGLGAGTTRALAALPVRGVIPAFFLGASIFAAAVYLGYISSLGKFTDSKPPTLLSYRLIRLADDFTRWTSYFVTSRIAWLHAAVISLGFGVLFLPVAFLNITDWQAFLAAGVAIGVILIFGFILQRVNARSTER